MADQYRVAIVPARVKKPRDKAAVENAVNVVNKRVIGYLDAEIFESLEELREAIAARVHEINYELVRADDATRIERFDAEEAPCWHHCLIPGSKKSSGNKPRPAATITSEPTTSTTQCRISWPVRSCECDSRPLG